MLNLARKIRSVLFASACGFIIIIGCIVAPLVAFIFKLNKPEVFHRGGLIWAKILIMISGMKLKVEGLENIPSERPLIFASNHQSYLDILILICVLPLRFRFVAWDALFNIPFLGTYMKQYGHIPISENNFKEAQKTVLEIIDLIKAGESIVIFPEGKLTRDGKLGRFSRGPAFIALDTRAPVIPVVIDGSFHVLPRGEWALRPGTVKIKIGKPLEFNHFDNSDKKTYLEATERLKNSIEVML